MGLIFMRIDADMAEAYDNAFRTQPRLTDVQAVREFRRSYAIEVVEGSLEGFG